MSKKTQRLQIIEATCSYFGADEEQLQGVLKHLVDLGLYKMPNVKEPVERKSRKGRGKTSWTEFQHEQKGKELTTVQIAEMWKGMSDDEKRPFKDRAARKNAEAKAEEKE